MLGTRLRLRPWLEQQINSGLYPGVQWIDQEDADQSDEGQSKEEPCATSAHPFSVLLLQAAGVFQIPWKHAARHGWSLEKDASLFRNWAIHTGRHRPGVDKPDPKTWKANFRCALNSLSDVRELQEKSRKRGHDAFRVYALLPQPRADGRTAPRCSRGEGRAAPAQTQRGVPLERPSGLSQIWSEEEEQTEAVLKGSEKPRSTGTDTSSSEIMLHNLLVKEEAWSGIEESACSRQSADLLKMKLETQPQGQLLEPITVIIEVLILIPGVLQIVDHLKTLDHSAPSYESERSWRDSYMWTGGLCDPVESSGFLLHPDGSFQQSSSAQFQEI
ncbi:hypothetical protein DNTS_021755 [Danionella cerebrum]|uniref:IRF tryptophan pentad repeat domain-containing protein n=1 Tax=Danionella cerebrum TaxID=2873325 RepID=A0A553QNN4_9TELE|nr:hypothetical protein DNTS_021755 [Danionella translucida]